MAHCNVCKAYEAHVMDGGTELAPCDDYDMSEPFKAWLVERMRDEVMGQVNGAGLDRMAILKDDQNAD